MIGTMLGNRYELLEKIGEGGMALVYKAKCHLLNRFVAVKILKKQFSNDSDFVKKFKREATAAASLSDNNIVDIYDVGTQDDINYIVMEYIDGKTLKQIITQNKRINTTRAVNIAIQISKALACAHKNNIIHRDIKPHNIMVTDDGVVKVTDFGIAKASNSVTITNSSKVMGSAHYFSPEQAKGSFVDFRTDIYSFGIVIYEMVTGRVPYDADSPVSVALKHIQEPVVPPIEINHDIPQSLNKLILKAIEKEPVNRYQDIKDMLTDLRRIEKNQDFNISISDLDDDMTRVMDPIVMDDDKNKNYNDKDDLEDDDEDNNEDNDIEDASKFKNLNPKKKKRILMAAIGLLVVVIGAVTGYFAFGKYFDASAKEVSVPNVVGMKQNDAKKAIEDKKLKFVLAGKEKSSQPEGTVIKTYPSSGTKVKANSEVRVSVSSGQDNLSVPNVVGVDLGSAKDIITSSGLKVGSITYKYSDSTQSGYVISQSPESDSNATSDTEVSIVVSRGPQIKNVTVPDVTGKGVDEAASILYGSGFKVSKSAITTNDKSQDGKVASQSISGSARQGSTVNLNYYQYKEPTTTPSDVNNSNNNGGNNGGDSNNDNGGNDGENGNDKGNGNGNNTNTDPNNNNPSNPSKNKQ
ncbi:Stk1 family PASTA domain-containing Ser/Thr kinase [Clostridium fermenticellae]|uniref:non-specific serine/threonine protein kinase n=1 Tax=Clostridium fermenticellae TaxID=2068654 RepID=A0A386H362_9CLOT|nr:Stk1 family PASTA domain-containing Ser/Thr kinase [Clostridium fermenticellae]AYD40018.1 Stk1 family PASTA domain-containing Ser/Thr kinase [Clostridium fermenticellae]